jgi:hypothetical protein
MGAAPSTPRLSRASLRKDAERFSQAHSWNKLRRCTVHGAVYYLALQRGEQPAPNGPKTGNPDGIHLWFIGTRDEDDVALVDKLPLICRCRPVILTADFEGHPGHPDSLSEVERQKTIEGILGSACAIAKGMDYEVVD